MVGKLLSCSFFFSIICFHLSATILVTHGMGTSGIQFYKDSGYIKTLGASATKIGHQIKSIAWLSPTDPNKAYAGLHPQERIAGASIIAKAIIDEQAAGQKVILIGHSFGGQVMQCATRLLNPANKEITDSFVYELVATIKDLLGEQKTKGVSPQKILGTLASAWHVSQVVLNAIEKANIINQHLIDYVRQHISLSYIDEIKKSWTKAFDEIQAYKKLKKVSHDHAVTSLYTIGTPFNGSAIFTADMSVVNHHTNLYSVEDTMPALAGSPCAPTHQRTSNLRVFFEPTRAFAPDHQSFCGNQLMAPWILLVPEKLQEQHIGSFDRFAWGTTGTITFFAQQPPTYQRD